MMLAGNDESPVIVVGAGLAGLCCARALHRAGVRFRVLEGADRVGGRVATDCVDGFLLDRGFQVFLTAYPEAAEVLDYRALRLSSFYPGALIQIGAKRYRFADPWRHPLEALGALRAPIASISDALRIARMRAGILKRTADDEAESGSSTREYLASQGMSNRVVERFFRPFFGGVFLDRDLRTSSGFFKFVFKMFARGTAALPAEGMQAIPQQIARQLPEDAVSLQCRVTEVGPCHVRLESGERIEARSVVVATDALQARRLLTGLPDTVWNGTTTVYFAAQRSPINEAVLVLNGKGGLVNHVCVPSDATGTYAPDGTALVSVSIIGVPQLDDERLEGRARAELADWFGPEANQWRLLRIYRIQNALPIIQRPLALHGDALNSSAVFMCGAYLATPSINGAMISGRQVAQEVIAALGNQR
jgi:phytoene dehydrogenase-like protein